MRLAPLESLLNRNVAASSAARALCQRLATKVLALHVDGVPLSVYFKSHGEHMTLHTDHEGTPDATLSGTPLSLLRLAGPAPKLHCAAARSTSRATPKSRRRSASCSRRRNPISRKSCRASSATSPHIRSATLRARRSVSRGARTTRSLQNVAEYLQEEGRDVPSRTEAEEFLHGVDRLRDDVDRLEARLKLLEARNNK